MQLFGWHFDFRALPFFNEWPRCLAAVDYLLFGVTAVQVPSQVSVLLY